MEITPKCNLNCQYCQKALFNNSPDDMTTDETIQLVKNLDKKHNNKKVLLTGGEPLLNKDICEIIFKIL